MIIILTVSFLAYKHWLSVPTPNTIIKPCGESPEEARAAGCTFDIMMDSWLSEKCYDEPLSREFRQLKEWPFYTDNHGIKRLNYEELSTSVQAHTTLEYHYFHCLFAVHKLHRAIAHGRYIEEDVAKLGHTSHCAGYLERTILRLNRSEEYELDHIGTKLNIAYPTCIDARSMLL
ncbi:hypothetical protein BP6252_08212 [Coleophoma cylindrospora]|uniref:Uncharacterized protein n=1 Tax=Coleophoma cylindrospora TaxID=1849047 RepID=A0A3D8R551_9HELO|nr:hypothetical protein BP6252_08212 [Coleophoma cylindrospora]